MQENSRGGFYCTWGQGAVRWRSHRVEVGDGFVVSFRASPHFQRSGIEWASEGGMSHGDGNVDQSYRGIEGRE